MMKISKFNGVIRPFMRKHFPLMVDIIFALSFILLFFGTLYEVYSLPPIGFLLKLKFYALVCFGGTMSLLLVFGVIYTLLDMRDLLGKNPRPAGGGSRPNPNPAGGGSRPNPNPAARAPKGDAAASRGNAPSGK